MLKQPILTGFEEYGLTIPEFYVTNVLLPESDANFKRIRELHTISLQKRMVEADTAIKTAQAEAATTVTVAQRQAILEQQNTETELARREAERDLIRAQTEAQKTRLSGYAEADVMHAQGIDKRDLLQADVQKAYAQGLGNMHISGGGVAGDMIGLGVGMAAAGAVNGHVGQMFQEMGKPFSMDKAEKNNSAEKHFAPIAKRKFPLGQSFVWNVERKSKYWAMMK